MFSTFSTDSSASGAASRDSEPQTPRPKRSQVARACDWCRLNRIKCDDNQPCRNCKLRGALCSNSRLPGINSLRTAMKEIERLRDQITNLEGQLENKSAENYVSDQRQLKNLHSSRDPQMAASSFSGLRRFLDHPPKGWEGTSESGTETGKELYYGPLSSPYLLQRMNRFLRQRLNLSESELELPASISESMCPLVDMARTDKEGGKPQDLDIEELSRAQETSFLELVWQSFHCIFPVLSETEFRSYYDGLWDGPGTQQKRQPSALIDGILSVCIQFGSSFLNGESDSLVWHEPSHGAEAARLAHMFYRRSQRLLMDELELPSITTIQSYIYCIIYLKNVCMFNTAHAILAVAIRIAHSLRLHLGPLEGTPLHRRDLVNRIWWTLYQLDNFISTTICRPSLIQPGDVTCTIPEDPKGSTQTLFRSAVHPDIDLISFHVQHVRLSLIARGIYTALQSKCVELLQHSNVHDIYDDPGALEMLSQCLDCELQALYQWVKEVPESLQNQRQGTSYPFSTDRTRIILDPACPLWLQRQRLILELVYHHLQISMLRPFVQFTSRAASLTPRSDFHSMNCLNHVVVLTNILYQVLSETDLLRGWTAVFQYQWDATVCILAFILANPLCPYTPNARKSLGIAIQALTLITCHIKDHPATQTAGKLANLVNTVANQFLTNLPLPGTSSRGDSIDYHLPQDGSATEKHSQVSGLSLPHVTSPTVTAETALPGFGNELNQIDIKMNNQSNFDGSLPTNMAEDDLVLAYLSQDSFLIPTNGSQAELTFTESSQNWSHRI